MRSSLSIFVVIVFFSACSTGNVDVDSSLGRFFDSAGVKGNFALFDNGQGSFTIYNLPRYRDSAYSPGATFDILQLLIGFQTGVVKDGNDVLVAPVPITLTQAFRSMSLEDTCIFQKLARNIGMDTLKKWVDSLHYGNRNLSGDPEAFWKDDSLKITSDEQLGLTKKLYFNQLPFFRRPQELVHDMMRTESNSNYKLVYKTALVPYKHQVMGWVMGWVEENKHPYFFVLNVVSPDPQADISSIGLQLVKRILSTLGFFEGKK